MCQLAFRAAFILMAGMVTANAHAQLARQPATDAVDAPIIAVYRAAVAKVDQQFDETMKQAAGTFSASVERARGPLQTQRKKAIALAFEAYARKIADAENAGDAQRVRDLNAAKERFTQSALQEEEEVAARIEKFQQSPSGERQAHRYLSPAEVLKSFRFPNSSFRVDGDAVSGEIGPGTIRDAAWLAKPFVGHPVEFGFMIKAPRYHIAAVTVDSVIYELCRGNWANQGTSVTIADTELRLPGVVETPEKWKAIAVTVDAEAVTFRYEGKLVLSVPLQKPLTPQSPIVVGFRSYDGPLSVKDVYVQGR